MGNFRTNSFHIGNHMSPLVYNTSRLGKYMSQHLYALRRARKALITSSNGKSLRKVKLI